MGRFLKNRTVNQFKKDISDLIDDLGREIEIYVGSGIPSATWDPINQEDLDPNAEIEYDDTVYTVTAIIEWNDPIEYEYLSGGKIAPGDVKIRCRIEDVLASGTDINGLTLFDVCRKVVVDGETLKVEGKPIKSGLRDLYLLDIVLSRMVNTG